MPVVVLIGMSDVHAGELAWLRERLGSLGIETVPVDPGSAEAVGRLDGVLSVCGDTEISADVPKLVISDGDAEDPGGGAQLYGHPPFSSRLLANAADAITAMVTGRPGEGGEGPIIGVTMAGVTGEGVQAAQELLSILGYEVLVFRDAEGSYETVAASGLLTAALDVSLLDVLRPGRLEGAVQGGIPQVVSLGGLDVAGSSDQAAGRTTADEAAELGRRVARRLRDASAPTALYLPLGGLSSLSVAAEPLHDPVADAALFDAVRDGLASSRVELHELETDINDPVFGRAMADHLHTLLTGFSLTAATS